MTSWPLTPKTRQIMEFHQDGGEIVSLGWDVWYLGQYMDTAAGIMEGLANGSDGQQGQAVDELRTKVGDAHVQLALAGELYKPIGMALKHYGAEVRDTISTQINTRHQTASDAWNTYVSLPGDRGGRSYFLGIGEPEAGSPEQEQHETEDRLKQEAWEDWIAAGDAYDLAYDSWETAWDAAVAEVDDGFSDDLKDSRWEKFKEGFNAFAEVLSWAGLVIGILALVIGGPILAAIAAAIAVIALAVTIVQALYGDKSGWDVAWAVVDVIPFGKVGKLFQTGQRADFAKDMVKNFPFKGNATYTDAFDAVKKFPQDGFSALTGNSGFKDVAARLLTGKDADGWKKIWTDNFDMQNFRNRANPHFADWLLEIPIRGGSAMYETAWSLPNHVFRVEGWVTKVDNAVTGDDRTSWRNSNPITRTIW